jgi:20S proteasome alpha/beta subunit
MVDFLVIDSAPYNRYQGHIGAALVLGGYDINGPQLYTIYPHGSTDKLPYVTMGSGSLAAMSVFESKWRPNLTVSLNTYSCRIISLKGQKSLMPFYLFHLFFS